MQAQKHTHTHVFSPSDRFVCVVHQHTPHILLEKRGKERMEQKRVSGLCVGFVRHEGKVLSIVG